MPGCMKPFLMFDYDGTIHRTMKIYLKAFQETYDWLVSIDKAVPKKYKEEEVAEWLGMNAHDMWDLFMPTLPTRIKEEGSYRIGKAMLAQIEAHQAEWYDGAEEMLTALKEQGFEMVVLSNCKKAYRDANWKEFRMDRWFSKFYDCESYDFLPKSMIAQFISKEYDAPFVIIGDRYSDIACAAEGRGFSIGCMYGYGKNSELYSASFLAEEISDIPELVDRICKIEL